MDNKQYEKIIIKLDHYLLHGFKLYKFKLVEFSTDKNCPLLFSSFKKANNIVRILKPRMKKYKVAIDVI